MLIMIYTSLSSNGVDKNYQISSRLHADTFTGDKKVNINFNCNCFTQNVSNKDMSLNFKILISRSKRINLLGKRRYISSIEIETKSGYHRDTIYIDNYYYKSTYKSQKKIFDFLLTNMAKKTITDETSKIDNYLSELKKSFNKEVLRDDKLDELLK